MTIEDGCGQVNQYSAGQGFETSEGRVHRAYNLGSVDARIQHFHLPPNRPITVNIPKNEHRCAPRAPVKHAGTYLWTPVNHPAPSPCGPSSHRCQHRRRITLCFRRPRSPDSNPCGRVRSLRRRPTGATGCRRWTAWDGPPDPRWLEDQIGGRNSLEMYLALVSRKEVLTHLRRSGLSAVLT